MKKLILIVAMLLLFTASVSAQYVTLDHVDGAWDVGKIQPGCEITFYIRINNITQYDIDGITNGFKVWTTGGNFTPIVGDTIFPGFTANFDVHNISYHSADGIAVDTVGFGFSKVFFGDGLPAGHNEITYSITTGGVEPGETLCLDSAFFPPTGEWRWADADGGNFIPSWDGPHCFLAEVTTLGYEIFNAPDTIRAYTCDTIQFDFDAQPIFMGDSTQDWGNEYEVLEGPGSIDSNGNWFFIAGVDDINTIQQLRIGVNGSSCTGGTSLTVLDLLDSEMPGDLNQSCTVDVGDLVFMVSFMFADGTPPPVMNDADVNGSGSIDIGDLVYMVSYMFDNGPPPVDPPPLQQKKCI